MADQPTAQQTNQTDQRPISSQEYLQQLRQQRQQRTAPGAETTTDRQHTAGNRANARNTTQNRATGQTAQPNQSPQSQQPQSAAPEQSPQPQPQSAEQQNQLPDYLKPQPEEDLMQWTAPTRPFKKRNAQYYFTVGAIVVLVSLILFFAGQLLPIAVVISVGFLAYVMSSVPPTNSTYRITTYGIRIDDQLYFWEELGRFWSETKYSQEVIHLETARFPHQITLLFDPQRTSQHHQEVSQLLSEVLLNEKPTPTFFDKAAAWLQEKIPLDSD